MKLERIEEPWTEEQWFECWCQELIEAGYIDRIETGGQVTPIVLFEQVDRDNGKKQVKFLERVTYKPDVLVYWNIKAKGIFFQEFSVKVPKVCALYAHEMSEDKWISPVEVKAPPGYGGANTSDASFRILHKWVYWQTGIYVNKTYNHPIQVIKYKKPHPQAGEFKRFKNPQPYLWMLTYTPERYLYTDKTLVPRTISKWDPITLEQFLASKQQ